MFFRPPIGSLTLSQKPVVLLSLPAPDNNRKVKYYFNSSSTNMAFPAALTQSRSPKEYEEVSAMLLTVFRAVNLP
jgi:hypothetical protein